MNLKYPKSTDTIQGPDILINICVNQNNNHTLSDIINIQPTIINKNTSVEQVETYSKKQKFSARKGNSHVSLAINIRHYS